MDEIQEACAFCEFVYEYGQTCPEDGNEHFKELYNRFGDPVKFWDSTDGLEVGLWQRANTNTFMLAFRGTDEKQDWTKYDLQITQYEIKNGIYVHQGFYNFIQCDGFQNEVEKRIRDLQPERVIVTGHSLGAGAAVLSSYFLAQTVPEVKFETITFGGPEIGDIEFGNDFMQIPNLSPLFRVTHRSDPVVMVNMAHYEHFGHELCLKYPFKRVALYAATKPQTTFKRFCEYCACWCCTCCGSCDKEYNVVDFIGAGAHRIRRYRIALDDIKGDVRDQLDAKIDDMIHGENNGSQFI